MAISRRSRLAPGRYRRDGRLLQAARADRSNPAALFESGTLALLCAEREGAARVAQINAFVRKYSAGRWDIDSIPEPLGMVSRPPVMVWRQRRLLKCSMATSASSGDASDTLMGYFPDSDGACARWCRCAAEHETAFATTCTRRRARSRRCC